jgi:hypothetical protein
LGGAHEEQGYRVALADSILDAGLERMIEWWKAQRAEAMRLAVAVEQV